MIYCDPEYLEPQSSGGVLGWPDPRAWVKDLDFGSNYVLTTNIEEYVAASDDVKIAFDKIMWWMFDAVDWNQVIDREFERIVKLSQASTLVLVLETEIYMPCHLLYPNYNLKNVYWIMPGMIDQHQEYIIPWHYHCERIAELYQKPVLQRRLRDLKPYEPKPKYFDALLGGQKTPRVFLTNLINKNQANQYFIHSMFLKNTNAWENGDQIVWEPDVTFEQGQRNHHTMLPVQYHGLSIPYVNVVPVSVYQQTAYSVVSETGFSNDIHMITEKAVKPMLARRLFVVFAGRGYLQHMRDSGFQTFGNVIDESYDLIENDQERWTTAFNEIMKLCQRDQQQVLELARPACEHNYKLITSGELTQQAISHTQKIINDYTKI